MRRKGTFRQISKSVTALLLVFILFNACKKKDSGDPAGTGIPVNVAEVQ